MKKQIFEITSPQELNSVAQAIINLLPTSPVVLLKGDLASGKTTLVKAILGELNIKEEATSPTFSIMIEYENEPTVYHYDIYQKGSEDFISSNLWQNILSEGYHFIEWADERVENLLDSLGIKFVTVVISLEQDKRKINIHE
jgi:tRNA threonylcarbamoyladenosine biosynthesis protein TsaE